MLRFSLGPTRLWMVCLLMMSAAMNVVAAATESGNSTFPAGINPDVDPKHDPRNPLKYITNNVLSSIGIVLTIIVVSIQTYLIVKTKAKYMLVLVIAECCYAIGIAARYGLHYQPDSRSIYIIEYLFITLSPCGFVAAEYVILGRLVHWVNGDRYLLVGPSRVTKVFVASDVVTFLIQAGGGILAVSNQTDIDKIRQGEHIVLVGLVLQLISFIFFTSMFLHFVYKIHKHEPQTWFMDSHKHGIPSYDPLVVPWYNDWRAFVFAVGLSCVGVLIRSIYRTIEFASGSQGVLTTTEIYFWVLDFVPLILAIGVYIPFWPGRFIGRSTTSGTMTPTTPTENLKMNESELVQGGSTTNIPLCERV
ncbi:RTA1 like protein-domain-containing protein [Irpex rosettiformis]|uniref:RTA1 like protein-domain-containing protein n=1 Tax=Irpex rosettiformis TaxID=378272 RepID=A0ACB8UF08_9APHY|nr:RTA1 like protein-domain-containing protein [Irpex rosettiformis]